MSRKFKVGDLVKAIKYDSGLNVGQIYEVKDLAPEFDPPVLSDFAIHVKGKSSAYFENYFEPIPQPKFKVGDKVRAIESDGNIATGKVYTVTNTEVYARYIGTKDELMKVVGHEITTALSARVTSFELVTEPEWETVYAGQVNKGDRIRATGKRNDDTAEFTATNAARIGYIISYTHTFYADDFTFERLVVPVAEDPEKAKLLKQLAEAQAKVNELQKILDK